MDTFLTGKKNPNPLQFRSSDGVKDFCVDACVDVNEASWVLLYVLHV